MCPQFGNTLTLSPLVKSARQMEQHLYLNEFLPFALGVTETAELTDERLEDDDPKDAYDSDLPISCD